MPKSSSESSSRSTSFSRLSGEASPRNARASSAVGSLPGRSNVTRRTNVASSQGSEGSRPRCSPISTPGRGDGASCSAPLRGGPDLIFRPDKCSYSTSPSPAAKFIAPTWFRRRSPAICPRAAGRQDRWFGPKFTVARGQNRPEMILKVLLFRSKLPAEWGTTGVIYRLCFPRFLAANRPAWRGR